MSAYYNEIDPFAAAWLRELITEGLIAPGDVDERSIWDVPASDLVGYRQCHFFAGIGGWSLALRLAGWPDDRPVWTGSCPCQPFSAAGRRAGLADERHVWPAFHWLIQQGQPPCVFGEQVDAAIRFGWIDLVRDDLAGIGYTFGVVDLPAACVGAPHIRQRLWWVADREGSGLSHGGAVSVLTEPCASSRDTGELADARSERRDGQRLRLLAGESRQASAEARRDGEVGGLADAGCERRQQFVRSTSGEETADGQARRRESHGDFQLAGHGAAGELADTDGRKCRQGVAATEHTAQSVAVHRDTHFWSRAEWLLCRDGKARPVEPGIFPLAHGVSGRVAVVRPGVKVETAIQDEIRWVSRAGALRGAGNAIVPQVAAAFIAAYLDTKEGGQ